MIGLRRRPQPAPADVRRQRNHDLRALVSIVLANEALWGTDLTLLPGMLDAVAANLQGMLVDGTRATAAAMLGISEPS